MVEGVYCSNVTNNSTAFTNRAIVYCYKMGRGDESHHLLQTLVCFNSKDVVIILFKGLFLLYISDKAVVIEMTNYLHWLCLMHNTCENEL